MRVNIENRIKENSRLSSQDKNNRLEKLHSEQGLYVGIDIGSTSSDLIVVNDRGETVFFDYQRTAGSPLETVRVQLEEMLKHVNPSQVTLTAATGSAGRLVAKLLGICFVNEVPAQAAAIRRLYPEMKDGTIIEMGGQDSKLIFISSGEGSGLIRDFAINTVCAAGTGSFLDQQATRLGVDIENEFGELAIQSKNVPRIAGRCSVFAKSDMIHLQQQATPNCDIIAGLCLALARNLKSNLGCGRKFVKPMIFTGGVAANIGVVRAMENVFDLEEGELIVPERHFFTGALGAVLVAKERGNPSNNGKIDLSKIDGYLTERGTALQAAPRREALSNPTFASPLSLVRDDLLCKAGEPIEAYLGVDVGSISTNVAVIDKENNLLAKAYLMTAGQPLEAVRQGLEMVGEKVCGKVNILAAATTGSGRYLTGDFIGADVVINEITAQAAGAAIVNPEVDTIFEIGGQDSKYISLENGVVVDFEMNHACAAGTGSFLEEQSQRLGINIEGEFAELAFKSDSPIKLGERCTVFMESDLLSYQQQGAKTAELVSGLSYSIVSNYLNRVVGRRRIGDNICFQGGTAFNKAVWAAFEKVTGKPIMVPDHHEVTGAIGAAAIAGRHEKQVMANARCESKFRGFENLAHIDYSVESFACEHCSNHCEIKKVQLSGSEPLYYGSRCDRYNLKKAKEQTKGIGAFEYRQEKLFEFAGMEKSKDMDSRLRGNDSLAKGGNDSLAKGGNDRKNKGVIGIPSALINWQLLPLFSRFFKGLGFEVVLSGKTNKRIIRMGVESVTAQICFPAKVAFGHVEELIGKNVDHIFLPSIVSMTQSFPENKHNQLCPYVQSLPYQVKTAFADRLGETNLLMPVIQMGQGRKLLEQSFAGIAKDLLKGKAKKTVVQKALDEGLTAQQNFEKALKDKGAEILETRTADRKLFVLVSRPYNGCDDGLNLQLPKKLAELGVDVIPMDMLDLGAAELGDKDLHRETYWSYGQKILRAAEIIKKDDSLFGIYLSNFACGPDSFIQTFFKDIMGRKPCLQLELDEHSADAGVITRLEAFLESLKHYQQGKQRQVKRQNRGRYDGERILYVPYMSDCSYGIAAAIRAYGHKCEAIALADEASLLEGRRYTTGKECLPCAITTGDMLKIAKEKGAENVAFFMPNSCGPCRFGMYNSLHRLILRQAGMEGVPILSPNQDANFYRELMDNVDESSRSSSRAFIKHIWAAAVGIDLLGKVILRVRPIAVEAENAQRVYDQSLNHWIKAVEDRSSLGQLRELMSKFAEDFGAVEVDKTSQKARIGVVGEIYVRSHQFANKNIIARLERLGAVCDLAPLAEWIYYTNFLRKESLKRAGKKQELLKCCVLDYFQHRIEKILAGPLEKKFAELAEEPVEETIKFAKPYIHHSFQGEAVLSVGKMVEYHHKNMGGVVNVMPFSCMPSTIVSTQTMRISGDCGDMPILNLSFDGQDDATLTTRLEAFVEQVRARQLTATVPVA
ncbi:acyl-CoA dehydratase activase [Planctomycetota bacterium]